jgi:hypothetical protein
LGLEDSLDNLLFFNQESTDNAVSDTETTTGTTIGTGDVLLGLGDSGELARTKSLDLFLIERVYLKMYSKNLMQTQKILPSFFFNTYTSECLTTVTTTRSLDRLLLVVVDKSST